MSIGRNLKTLTIDTATASGAAAARRLEEEQIVWLTTVGPDLTPQPSPVWFYWDGDTVIIYSDPRMLKIRNIEKRPRVSLSFNTTAAGRDVVILTGDAWIDESAPASNAHPEYLGKYTEAFVSVGLSPDELTSENSVAIRVRPTSLREH